MTSVTSANERRLLQVMLQLTSAGTELCDGAADFAMACEQPLTQRQHAALGVQLARAEAWLRAVDTAKALLASYGTTLDRPMPQAGQEGA